MARGGFRTKIAASQILVEQRTIAQTGGLEVTANDALKVDYTAIVDIQQHTSLESKLGLFVTDTDMNILSLGNQVNNTNFTTLSSAASLDSRITSEVFGLSSVTASLELRESVISSLSNSVDTSLSTRVTASESFEYSLKVSLESKILTVSAELVSNIISSDFRSSFYESENLIKFNQLYSQETSLSSLLTSKILSVDSRVSLEEDFSFSSDTSTVVRISAAEMASSSLSSSLDVKSYSLETILTSSISSVDISLSAISYNRASNDISIDLRLSDISMISTYGVIWKSSFNTIALLKGYLNTLAEGVVPVGWAYYVVDLKAAYVVSQGLYSQADNYVASWPTKYLVKISDHGNLTSSFGSVDSRIYQAESVSQSIDALNISKVASIDSTMSFDRANLSAEVLSLETVYNNFGGIATVNSIDSRLSVSDSSLLISVLSLDAKRNNKVSSLEGRLVLIDNAIPSVDFTSINSGISSLSSRILIEELLNVADSNSLSVNVSSNLSLTLSADMSLSSNLATNIQSLDVEGADIRSSLISHELMDLTRTMSLESRLSVEESLAISHRLYDGTRTFLTTFKIGALGPDPIQLLSVFNPDSASGLSILKTSKFNMKNDILENADSYFRNSIRLFLNGIILHPEISYGNIRIFTAMPQAIDGDYALINLGANYGIIFPFNIMFLDKLQINYG